MRAVVLALFVTFATPAYAQSEHDGGWWNNLNATAKISVLAGFLDGSELGKKFAT